MFTLQQLYIGLGVLAIIAVGVIGWSIVEVAILPLYWRLKGRR
jgi:hypothetical protein